MTLSSQPDKYLQSGEQTKVTSCVEEIARRFRGYSCLEQVSQILAFVKTFPNKGFDRSLFRKRTASQIMRDGYITGCSDSALVFIALARSTGLPTKYIEALDRDWLEHGGNTISGHVYAEVYDMSQSRWLLIDPMGNMDIPKPNSRVFLREGFDSWDIGIDDFDSMKTQATEFRTEWLRREEN